MTDHIDGKAMLTTWTATRRLPRLAWQTLRIFLFAYLGMILIIYLIQASFVFRPETGRDDTHNPGRFDLRFQSVRLSTVDGESIDGWYVPAQPRTAPRALVIFFHGNAGHIGHRIEYVRMFHALGFATLAIDYRGYGRSSGIPSEVGTYLDADAAWEFARRELQYSEQRIILFGESLGGGVAMELAAKHRPAAVVLYPSSRSLLRAIL